MRLPWIFATCTGAGIIFGILIITGQSIDPIDILILVGNTINNTLSGISPGTPNPWAEYSPWIPILAIGITILTIILIIISGIKGIFVAIFSFLGGLIFILGVRNAYFSLIGIILIIFGGLLSTSKVDHRTEYA